ncbi:50S ribosomal protein L29 [Candidatus Kaiserbacteria bacterium]|nr:50S ribosomal protein L29 [Candidatus Kaiserbacteria bacterium]
MSKKTDITKQSDKDLIEAVNTKREEIRNFRFSNTGSATRNVRVVRTAKKEIARSLTELNRRARTLKQTDTK